MSGKDEADLISVCFDTLDHCLRRAGLGLRVRRVGERFLQTLMAEGDGLSIDLNGSGRSVA